MIKIIRLFSIILSFFFLFTGCSYFNFKPSSAGVTSNVKTSADKKSNVSASAATITTSAATVTSKNTNSEKEESLFYSSDNVFTLLVPGTFKLENIKTSTSMQKFLLSNESEGITFGIIKKKNKNIYINKPNDDFIQNYYNDISKLMLFANYSYTPKPYSTQSLKGIQTEFEVSKYTLIESNDFKAGLSLAKFQKTKSSSVMLWTAVIDYDPVSFYVMYAVFNIEQYVPSMEKIENLMQSINYFDYKEYNKIRNIN